ncbi:MAG: hypothetical protein HOV80_35275 [Polyangiaceae bacterium]|nr:hypothetical protein [Polyangiaceae bacterium]
METTACERTPVRRVAPAPVDDGAGPALVKVGSQPATFAKPLVPGRFQKLEMTVGGTCLLRESGELTCLTTKDRPLKRPKGAAIFSDSTEEIGSAVVPPGNHVVWGKLTLPKGPFRDFSGTAEFGCAITPEDRLECWGESTNVRAFPAKLGDRKIASVAVRRKDACAVTIGGDLLCLEGPERGEAKADRQLVRAEGTFAAVDVRGFHWAIAADGTGVLGHIKGDFAKVERRVPGCFSELASAGDFACGIERGRARCIDANPRDPARALDGMQVEKIVPGDDYFCFLAGGKATCLGKEERLPPGAPVGLPARDVAGHHSAICILDELGALRCQGKL